jgi:flagellar motor switch protein FliG
MIVSLGEDHNTDQINTLIKKDTALSIFDEFQQTKVASISDFLKNEHPQVIALIFSQLKSDKAAQLLSTFEKEKQADIMNRLVVMNEISPDVIVEISEVIQENFGFMNIEGEETLSGTSMVAQILNNTDQDVEENILGSISKYDEDLSTQVRDQMFLFTDILNIDKDAMQAINLEIDKADLAKALKGQAIELADKFFNNMSGRAAEMIKEDMENLGPLKAADVKEAQQNIIRKIRDLEAKGEIVLNSDEEDFIE